MWRDLARAGTEHQGRAKVTVDQPVADFLGRTGSLRGYPGIEEPNCKGKLCGGAFEELPRHIK